MPCLTDIVLYADTPWLFCCLHKHVSRTERLFRFTLPAQLAAPRPPWLNVLYTLAHATKCGIVRPPGIRQQQRTEYAVNEADFPPAAHEEIMKPASCPPLDGSERPHEGLDTGDLVLFDRPCLKMGGFFGAAICAAAKVVGGSPFDHIGVVVRKTEREIIPGCKLVHQSLQSLSEMVRPGLEEGFVYVNYAEVCEQ